MNVMVLFYFSFYFLFLRSTYSPQLRHIKYPCSLTVIYQASHQCKGVGGIIVLLILLFKFGNGLNFVAVNIPWILFLLSFFVVAIVLSRPVIWTFPHFPRIYCLCSRTSFEHIFEISGPEFLITHDGWLSQVSLRIKDLVWQMQGSVLQQERPTSLSTRRLLKRRMHLLYSRDRVWISARAFTYFPHCFVQSRTSECLEIGVSVSDSFTILGLLSSVSNIRKCHWQSKKGSWPKG
jgi:hypothetical protein